MTTPKRGLLSNASLSRLAGSQKTVRMAKTMRRTRLFASACLALVFFSSGDASAQLLEHRLLQSLSPTEEETGPSPDFLDNQHNEFGYYVAIRNGLAFIGMPATLTVGRVAVFTHRPAGWIRTGTITASDMTSDDRFGQVISFRDGLVVVGSHRAAYVFKRVNGVWREQQKIVPPTADRIFSFAVAIAHRDGVLAIGAVAQGGPEYLYVYEQNSAGRFVRRARLGGAGAGFGRSIGMTNTMIVTGSTGAAYIIGRNSKGHWVQRQKLVPADASIALGFGSPVAVDRGMILVGGPSAPVFRGEEPLPGEEPDPAIGTTIYGFVPVRGQYTESFQLHVPADTLIDAERHFGYSMAMFGNHIVVAHWQHEPLSEGSGNAVLTTYLRANASVAPLPLGLITIGGGERPSISIANNLLLVGLPFGSACLFSSRCNGAARVYDLDQFAP
jgi:hypothetical protein